MHCITALSKDLRGELRVEEESADACRDPECRTITARCGVRAEIVPHAPCDDAPGFGGRLRAKVRFRTKDEPEGRGIHDGKYEIQGAGGVISGTLQGTVNVGTHRFDPANCERCEHVHHLEGVMEGRVVDGKREGDRFPASYAMRLDVGKEPHDFHVDGAIEGALLHTCPQTG